jgi:hypothetical protein
MAPVSVRSAEGAPKHLLGHCQIGFHDSEADREANGDEKHGSFRELHAGYFDSATLEELRPD